MAGLASTISSTVVANPAAVTIPGSTTVTVTLADQYGNPVDDATVALAGTGSALVSPSPVNTGATNVALFSVSDPVVETSTLSADPRPRLVLPGAVEAPAEPVVDDDASGRHRR